MSNWQQPTHRGNARQFGTAGFRPSTTRRNMFRADGAGRAGTANMRTGRPVAGGIAGAAQGMGIALPQGTQGAQNPFAGLQNAQFAAGPAPQVGGGIAAGAKAMNGGRPGFGQGRPGVEWGGRAEDFAEEQGGGGGGAAIGVQAPQDYGNVEFATGGTDMDFFPEEEYVQGQYDDWQAYMDEHRSSMEMSPSVEDLSIEGMEMVYEEPPQSLEDVLREMMEGFANYDGYNDREDELWAAGEREAEINARILRGQAGLAGVGSSGYLDAQAMRSTADIADRIKGDIAEERRFAEQMQAQYGEMGASLAQWMLEREDATVEEWAQNEYDALQEKKASGDWTEDDATREQYLIDMIEEGHVGTSQSTWQREIDELDDDDDDDGDGDGGGSWDQNPDDTSPADAAKRKNEDIDRWSVFGSKTSNYSEDAYNEVCSSLVEIMKVDGWSEEEIKKAFSDARESSMSGDTDFMTELQKIAETLNAPDIADNIQGYIDDKDLRERSVTEELDDWAASYIEEAPDAYKTKLQDLVDMFNDALEGLSDEDRAMFMENNPFSEGDEPPANWQTAMMRLNFLIGKLQKGDYS